MQRLYPAGLSMQANCRAEEEADFKEYAARPNVFDDITGRIARQIFGHHEIKQAVACLLFGGSRKVWPTLLPYLVAKRTERGLLVTARRHAGL